MIGEEYYNPNSSEKALMAENKAYAEKAISLAYKAGAVSSLFYLRFGDGDDSDAFRHCLWAAFIAKETNVDWSIRWTKAHEDFEGNDRIAKTMDDHNNEMGVGIILKNPTVSYSAIIESCSQLIISGGLKVISKNKLQESTAKGFNIPNIFRVISERVNEVLDFIAEYHLDKLRSTDDDGNTALIFCILRNYKEGFDRLVSVVDVNQIGMHGMSPLIVCATLVYGQSYAIDLIGYGANPDFQSPHNGETALMLAAVYGNREMVEVLVKVSDKNIRSFNGSTAYDKAMSENHLEIAKLLV